MIAGEGDLTNWSHLGGCSQEFPSSEAHQRANGIARLWDLCAAYPIAGDLVIRRTRIHNRRRARREEPCIDPPHEEPELPLQARLMSSSWSPNCS